MRIVSSIATSDRGRRWPLFGLKFYSRVEKKGVGPKSGLEVQTFFMLNSAEHEIFPAHKC